MKSIFSPMLRRIGSIGGGALIAAGMTVPAADMVVNAFVALGLFGLDIALSRFNFMRSN